MIVLTYLLLGIPVIAVRAALAIYFVHSLPQYRSALTWTPARAVLMIVSWPFEVLAIALIVLALCLRKAST